MYIDSNHPQVQRVMAAQGLDLLPAIRQVQQQRMLAGRGRDRRTGSRAR